MKYLKTFENMYSKYQKGDYVLLLLTDDKSVQPQCKIINVDQNLGKYFEITIRYVVEVFNNYDELIETFVLEDEIKRRLRPKEIEKFENKKISVKFKTEA